MLSSRTFLFPIIVLVLTGVLGRVSVTMADPTPTPTPTPTLKPSAVTPLPAVPLSETLPPDSVIPSPASEADENPLKAAEPTTPVASSGPEPRFFFTAQLDAHFLFRGEGLLTPDAAQFANCYEFISDKEGRGIRLQYSRAGIPSPDPVWHVIRIDRELDPASGISERRWFRDEQGKPMADVDGIFGQEISYTGSVQHVLNLDANGRPLANNLGVTRYDQTRDEGERVIDIRRFNTAGAPIADNDGNFETRIGYDQKENPIEIQNFDANGHPLDDHHGIASSQISYTYETATVQADETTFTQEGLQAHGKETGVHAIRRLWDRRHFLLSESYLDERGGPMLNRISGIHERQWIYDDAGNIIAVQTLGLDNKLKTPVPDSSDLAEGASKVVLYYDSLNRVIAKTFFNENNEPSPTPLEDATSLRYTLDSQNRVVRLQFFNAAGKPQVLAKYRAPSVRFQYNDLTHTCQVEPRDENDRPVVEPDRGWASYTEPMTKAIQAPDPAVVTVDSEPAKISKAEQIAQNWVAALPTNPTGLSESPNSQESTSAAATYFDAEGHPLTHQQIARNQIRYALTTTPGLLQHTLLYYAGLTIASFATLIILGYNFGKRLGLFSPHPYLQTAWHGTGRLLICLIAFLFAGGCKLCIDFDLGRLGAPLPFPQADLGIPSAFIDHLHLIAACLLSAPALLLGLTGYALSANRFTYFTYNLRPEDHQQLIDTCLPGSLHDPENSQMIFTHPDVKAQISERKFIFEPQNREGNKLIRHIARNLKTHLRTYGHRFPGKRTILGLVLLLVIFLIEGFWLGVDLMRIRALLG